MYASERGNAGAVTQLLSTPGIDVNAADKVQYRVQPRMHVSFYLKPGAALVRQVMKDLGGLGNTGDHLSMLCRAAVVPFLCVHSLPNCRKAVPNSFGANQLPQGQKPCVGPS
jgi:hypothetical protein